MKYWRKKGSNGQSLNLTQNAGRRLGILFGDRIRERGEWEALVKVEVGNDLGSKKALGLKPKLYLTHLSIGRALYRVRLLIQTLASPRLSQ